MMTSKCDAEVVAPRIKCRGGAGLLKSVVEKIEALTREPGFIYTLALILMRDVFLSLKTSRTSIP